MWRSAVMSHTLWFGAAESRLGSPGSPRQPLPPVDAWQSPVRQVEEAEEVAEDILPTEHPIVEMQAAIVPPYGRQQHGGVVAAEAQERGVERTAGGYRRGIDSESLVLNLTPAGLVEHLLGGEDGVDAEHSVAPSHRHTHTHTQRYPQRYTHPQRYPHDTDAPTHSGSRADAEHTTQNTEHSVWHHHSRPSRSGGSVLGGAISFLIKAGALLAAEVDSHSCKIKRRGIFI
eukprot:COSAG02_NODE_12916_length_1472_cov_18.304443_2_plen_230_part_00